MRNTEFKSGDEVLFINPYGNGCYSIEILQNWRDILKISESSTSGTKGSDVWSEETISHITVKQLHDMIESEIIDPYGWNVDIIRSYRF